MAERAGEGSQDSVRGMPSHAPPWEMRTAAAAAPGEPERQLPRSEADLARPSTRRSGVYVRRPPEPEDPLGEAPLVTEELRVDVDGLFPTMTVSGTIFRLGGGHLNWIAQVTWDPASWQYVGPIGYRDGASALEPHTNIAMRLTGSSETTGSMHAHVFFSGGGQADSVRTYTYTRASFRAVSVEFTCTADAGPPVTSYSLGAHPNRPADLPDATLSIEDVFTRQGIEMTGTSGGNVLSLADAGAPRPWSDIEIHDAMQLHWSKEADTPQSRLWTLLAGRHDGGAEVGATAFGGPVLGGPGGARHGCAVFSQSFLCAEPPEGDPNPTAFARRMKFWALAHEIGHCLGLAHSGGESAPWIPLADEPETTSFMSAPYQVSGNAEAFFGGFHYRFGTNELRLLRHAPERFTEPGDASWFDHDAFERARRSSATPLELSLHVNRRVARYEALEPVVVELELKNTAPVPVVVDRHCLRSADVTIIITGRRRQARRWLPYAQHCVQAEPHVLRPGESISESCFLSGGRNGCDLAEQGRYEVYAALRTPVGHVLARPMAVRIDPPGSRDEERLAPDLVSDDVSRVLAFGGSRVLSWANDVLRETHGRLPARRIAVHAAAALARVETTPGRVLVEERGRADQRRFEMSQPGPDEALPELHTAYGDMDAAAETFGHLRLTDQVERAATALSQAGDCDRARDLTGRLANALEKRGAPPSVVRRLRQESAET